MARHSTSSLNGNFIIMRESFVKDLPAKSRLLKEAAKNDPVLLAWVYDLEAQGASHARIVQLWSNGDFDGHRA